MKFEEHDVVRATTIFISEGKRIRQGMEGTVVSVYDTNYVAVEFPEVDGVVTTHIDLLEAVNKKYLCVWGTGYNGAETKAIVKNMDNADSFSDDNGYDKEAIWKINSLMIGQCADLTDLSGFHYVIRVE